MTDRCFVCGRQAVAPGSALNPGGPVCWVHSWAKTEAEAEKRFTAAVRDIVKQLR
jgi:hypothetical protein